MAQHSKESRSGITPMQFALIIAVAVCLIFVSNVFDLNLASFALRAHAQVE